MRLSSRSYPYPVVGNRDDVPGSAFQAVLEMTSDKEAVYIDAVINSSSETVNQLVSAGDACYVMHIECSNTLYRHAFDFIEQKYRVTIPVDYLNDAVEVNVFARSNRELSEYRVESAHSDYGDAAFDVERGDLLAVAEGQVFYLESNFDSLSRFGSIMQITQSPANGDVPMRADFNGDKIVIYLSERDFAEYKLLKGADNIAVPLTTTIVLPVLIEALHSIDKDEDDDRRWVRVLRRRIEALELKVDGDALENAQLVLELPVKRTLASARMLTEGGTY
jgi:hypothetical protein